MKNRIVYLAGGNSVRFGSNKLLYEINGRPMFRHTLDILTDIISDEKEYSIIVVTQYHDIKEYADYINNCRVKAILNPDSRYGASYSIKAAINSLNKENAYDTFVVADQPGITRKSLAGLMRTTIASGKKTGCIRFDGKTRNPVMFHTSLESELMLLTGDEGGKKVLKRYLDDCCYYDITNKDEIEDIDMISLKTSSGSAKSRS